MIGGDTLERRRLLSDVRDEDDLAPAVGVFYGVMISLWLWLLMLWLLEC